jgi:DNA-binding CsgD family transcriptional regulator
VKRITICTRTFCVRESIKEMIAAQDDSESGNETLSVFAFEGPWISSREFSRLAQCRSDRILVMGKHVTLCFLSAILNSDKIKYVNLDEQLNKLAEVMRMVLGNQCQFSVLRGKGRFHSRALSHREYRVIEMYINGMSASDIARKLGRTVMTIYSIKSHGMSKLGITSDFGLVNHWSIIQRRALDNNNYRHNLPY